MIDLRDTIRSTGTVRAFTAEPVDDATLAAVLDDARFAPSGGNRQPWRVAVVHDATVREQLAALIQPVWDEYASISALGATPFALDAPTAPAERPHVPNALLDEIQRIPVVLAIAADRRKVALMDGGLDRPALTGGASVYPFCWNLLLAARARGLGGVMTTFLSRVEPAAAAVLGLPPSYALAATVFLGHPVHQPTRLRRAPVATFATVDRFDGPAFDVEPERVPMSDEASTDGATSHVAPNDDRTPLPAIDERADERTMLAQFLDYFRTVFLRKVEGLDDAQARVRVAASTMDLLGMTRHLVDVERWWFRGFFTQEVDSAVYDADGDPDADWHHGPSDTLAEAIEHWHTEVARAREILAAAPSLDTIAATTDGRRGEVTLRWIMIHMIEEYARHTGHADLLREAIDGTTDD